MTAALRLRPRALRPLLLAALIAAVHCGGGGDAPDVVLITVDTLRADELSPYDSAASATPHVAALAADGTLYERAAAPMGMTRPSHFSIFTGRYPREHGVLNNMTPLPHDLPVLAEMLRGARYRTAGFVGVNLLAAGSGAERGFEVLRAPTASVQRSGAEVVAEALEWVRRLGTHQRYFLWVHLFEPHQPYDPPARYRGGVDPELGARYPALDWRRLAEIADENGGDVPAAILDHAKVLYRGEARLADEWAGRLLDGLRELRGLDDALVIFTADHGECFEGGVFFEHSNCLLDGTSRVPLIVRYPPGFAAGGRVQTQVGLIDVAPTVLTAAGLEIPEAFSGRPLQEAGTASGRYLLLQYPFFQPGKGVGPQDLTKRRLHSVAGVPTEALLLDVERVGLVGEDWKYIETGGDAEELYPMRPTPDERENVADLHPEVRARLKAELERLLDRHRLHLVQPGAINDELLESLKSLGYL